MEEAQVFLVGAGPGDPGLMTLRGKELVEQADVLVYDRLVAPEIIGWVRPECEMIYVGKTPDHHTFKQDEINAILVEKAEPGKKVVRLKGGDPFVFGRGGEEAEELHAHNIPFEVVPGISSSIAAPAYAGIPVTHRKMASSFQVITGHEDPTKLMSALNWEQLAEFKGTLVFLMGMKNLPFIAEVLMAYSKPADTPVAVVEHGTWQNQRVITGTLETIALNVMEAGFTNPAVIVVGEVVTLHDQLKWFTPKPLAGKTVGITRARHQSSVLRDKLEALGATVEEFPVLVLRDPDDTTLLKQAAAQPGTFDWVVFTSANGVKMFFKELAAQENIDLNPFGKARVIAVGPATAKALEKRGVKSVLTPDSFQAEGVADILKRMLESDQRVLLVRAQEARTVVQDMVNTIGAELVDVPAYKTVLREDFKDALNEALREGKLDALTFASSSAARNTLTLVDGNKELLTSVKLFSIGPLTTQTMEELGIAPTATAVSSTIDGLVGAVANNLGGLE